MSERPRDWDRELAEIDKAMEQQRGGGEAGQGGGTVPAAPRPAPGLPPGAPFPAPRRGAAAITWFWVVLALALALALPLWPYPRECGLRAVFFIGACGVTAIVGGLAAASSWANRRAFAHVLSLLVLAWAVGMGASEVLPRAGYAREVKTWTCPDAPAATTPAPPPAPATEAPQPGAAADPLSR